MEMRKRVCDRDTDMVYDPRRWIVRDVPSHSFIHRVRILSLTRKPEKAYNIQGCGILLSSSPSSCSTLTRGRRSGALLMYQISRRHLPTWTSVRVNRMNSRSSTRMPLAQTTQNHTPSPSTSRRTCRSLSMFGDQ